MKKAIRHLLLSLCASAALLAAPAAAQTVELSTRTFWIGERPRTMDGSTPFIALREIGWIEAILRTDPALQDTVVHIEQTHMAVADVLARFPYEDDILLGPDRLPSKFDHPGYRIYGPQVATARSFTYMPADPGAGFFVRCSRRDDVEHMLLCVVYARYAPDDRIALKARLYFPPDPADRPTCFREVVERMREVAHCLDVTEELAGGPAARPGLPGCRIEPVS